MRAGVEDGADLSPPFPSVSQLSHPAGEVHTWETDDVDRIVVEQAIALASNGSRLDGVTASAVVA